MTTVKKNFIELIELLEANENKKISTIMPQILELVSSKTVQQAFRTEEDGELSIYCYYHKEWERVSEVEYGKKSSTKHGYNTMCKEGVSNWTKQQRQAKIAKEALLDSVANGETDPTTLNIQLEEIEANRVAILPLSE